MRLGVISVLSLFLLILTATVPPVVPTGVYRTAAQYRRQQPAPACSDVRLSDKRGSLVVTQQRGPARLKTLVPLDSVWGYVNGNGRSYRLYRGEEFQIQQADTLSIYSFQHLSHGPYQPSTGSYFFSRGLNGMIFPLTQKNLRLAYEASNPAFVEAIKDLGFTQSLSDYDVAAGSFRVVKLYRSTLGK
ncbi:hypothetical protein [Hymenobacter saemangeumensis]